jgi:hypothetical protein
MSECLVVDENMLVTRKSSMDDPVGVGDEKLGGREVL